MSSDAIVSLKQRLEEGFNRFKRERPSTEVYDGMAAIISAYHSLGNPDPLVSRKMQVALEDIIAQIKDIPVMEMDTKGLVAIANIATAYVEIPNSNPKYVEVLAKTLSAAFRAVAPYKTSDFPVDGLSGFAKSVKAFMDITSIDVTAPQSKAG